jgi:hypothetical protein
VALGSQLQQLLGHSPYCLVIVARGLGGQLVARFDPIHTPAIPDSIKGSCSDLQRLFNCRAALPV